MTRSSVSEIAPSLAAAGLLRRPATGPAPAGAPVPGPRPNILFVLVDEMRFPSVFPTGVEDAEGFLKAFMPNVHRLWTQGVKFSNYQTAANACSPARGTLLTGLYSQQTWMCCTITGGPTDTKGITPSLDPAFPTYGKLLRDAGYETPYIGKFHVAMLQPDEKGNGGDKYGFDVQLYPDMKGYNLQGTVGNFPDYLNDGEIAEAAATWLRKKTTDDDPWCLTIGFVNPHDYQFFWGGTEYGTYNALFGKQDKYRPLTFYSTTSVNGSPPIRPELNTLDNPPAYGYPAVPPNWESAERLAATKPSTQAVGRNGQALVWGGASDDPDSQEHEIVAYPEKPITERAGLQFGIGVAPHSYWRRGLDCYTKALTLVDQQIGWALDALPEDVAKNTVIVFASDHGEYAGAHGFLAGKILTAYKEVFNVPLIVVDPSGRFTGETEVIRDGLVSSVDLLRMFVSIGYNGAQDWLTGDMSTLYGNRLDILPMLKSGAAPGRDYVLLACDEAVPGFTNYENAPTHVLGLQTKDFKLGTYAHWAPASVKILERSVETELYDYASEGGRAELDNVNANPSAKLATDVLFDKIVPAELRAPLPESLQQAQSKAQALYLVCEGANRITRASQQDPGTPVDGQDLLNAFGSSF